jgi:hypothetical protein
VSRAAWFGATLATMLVACADNRAAPAPGGPSKLEASIATALGARLGAPIVAHCLWPLPACFARLPDGNALQLSVRETDSSWTWRVDGLLVSAAPLEAYIHDEADALGITTDVHCGPRLRRIAPRDRIECRLANGGAAWLTVRTDGSTQLELAIDAAAAAARGEVVTPDRERALSSQSHALEPIDEADDN